MSKFSKYDALINSLAVGHGKDFAGLEGVFPAAHIQTPIIMLANGVIEVDAPFYSREIRKCRDDAR